MRARIGKAGLGSANEHGLTSVNGKTGPNAICRDRLPLLPENVIQVSRKMIQESVGSDSSSLRK
jgi:hypothetical protein